MGGWGAGKIAAAAFGTCVCFASGLCHARVVHPSDVLLPPLLALALCRTRWAGCCAWRRWREA